MYHLGLDRILLSLLYDLQYTDLCVYLIRDPISRNISRDLAAEK